MCLTGDKLVARNIYNEKAHIIEIYSKIYLLKCIFIQNRKESFREKWKIIPNEIMIRVAQIYEISDFAHEDTRGTHFSICIYSCISSQIYSHIFSKFLIIYIYIIILFI